MNRAPASVRFKSWADALENAMNKEESDQLANIVMQCAGAVLLGQPTVTISTRGKRPAGFPRGELLSVGTNGSHNYVCHPVKLLAWIHSRTSKQPNSNLSEPRKL